MQDIVSIVDAHENLRSSDAATGLDKGAAALIASGEIKVKPGVELKSFVEDAVVFSDGSKLKVDAVIFA